ncbi:MAG: hypothetical protein KIG36_06525 [Eubacteriales bacterium]|nr:hypothetical protein [Eubacteriales bacterium]
MKKTISLVAVILALCIGFAAISEAKVMFVSNEDTVKVVSSTTATLDYFSHTNNIEFENVEVNGERLLKADFSSTINFRLNLTSDAGLESRANTVGYDFYRIRLKTAAGASGTGMAGGCEIGGNVLYDRFYFVDLGGSLVASTAAYSAAIPADFDGYLYIGLTHWTWQGGALGSRDKNDTTPVLGPEGIYGPDHYYDPTSVSRMNCNWTVSGDVYFGETALVSGELSFAPANNLPSNTLNFTVVNGLNELTDADLASPTLIPYAAAGCTNGTGEIVDVATGDKALRITMTEDGYNLSRLCCVGFDKPVAQYDDEAVAIGFMIRTGDKPISFWQFQTPEGGSLFSSGRLYTETGLYVGVLDNSLTIPANFTGYAYYPITDAQRSSIDLASFIYWFGAETGATCDFDNFGYYSAEPEMAQIVGVQESAASNGTFDVRIVAGLDDLAFNSLLFEYNATENSVNHWADYQQCAVTEVYEAIHVDGFADDAAADYGYNYFAALTIQGIPATGAIDIAVHMISASEADPANWVTSQEMVVHCINGVIDSVEWFH